MDKELAVINRNLVVDGMPVRVLHLRLDEKGMVHLEILTDLRERYALVEELRRSNRAEAIEHPATKREKRRNEIEFDWPEPLRDTESVEIGGVRFEVRGCSGRSAQPGWRRYDFRMRGTFEALPQTDGPLRIIREPKEVKFLAETPVTLTVGEGVQRIEDGSGRWVNILEVGITDILELWERHEMDDRRRAQQEEVCPCGMGFLTLVYECPEDLTPEFCTADWLAEAPKGNSGMGLIVQVPKERGPNGLPLRPASVEGAVPLDAKTIRAELFSWEKKEDQPDILL